MSWWMIFDDIFGMSSWILVLIFITGFTDEYEETLYGIWNNCWHLEWIYTGIIELMIFLEWVGWYLEKINVK